MCGVTKLVTTSYVGHHPRVGTTIGLAIDEQDVRMKNKHVLPGMA